MKSKIRKGEIAVISAALIVLIFSFAVVPSVLAATPGESDVQTVTGNTAALNEHSSAAADQVEDYNAISEEQAITNAMDALESRGFDTQDFKDQSTETRYLAENAPAGDPVWVVIFRDNQEGYAYVRGDEVNDETGEKLAAIGEIETWTDESGNSGIRAHYSYTRYTIVEINALSGEYVRHGTSIVEPGEPLEIEKARWN